MKEQIQQELLNTLGFSPMLDQDKRTYIKRHPDNIVVYNANIFAKGIGKLWYGDLDITENSVHLFIIARKFNTPLYVLKEQDGRFNNENRLDFDKVAEWSTEN